MSRGQLPTPHAKPKSARQKNSPKVNTQVVADTGAQNDILSLATLKCFGFDPDTLIKVQVKVTTAVKGSQMDIRSGIFLSVRSPNHSNHHKTVRLFYVACNVSQDYVSHSCLQALSMVGQDFPMVGAATSA